MKTGLALSGGAALGMAHIGVLKYLEEIEDVPVCLAGTSAGSIVASLYCAGISPEEIEGIALNLNWKEVARPALPRWGMLDSVYIAKLIEKHIGRIAFAELKKPLFINAVDLISGKEIMLHQGRVSLAVAASCAVPGIFTPVKYEDKLLVDGGVVNNLPLNLLRDQGLDRIIGVDLSTRKTLDGSPKNIFEILLQSFLILQRYQRSIHESHADLIIEPELDQFALWDISNSEQLIHKGYESCKQALANGT